MENLFQHSKATLNNFDLIRLFAATQVAISHISSHLEIAIPGLSFLSYFPGVPIFFFISGYLIYQSYANLTEGGYKIFFTNRFLRLYPALLFCFAISVLSLYVSGYLASQSFTALDFSIWGFTQLTFFQFYNPDFLRKYGVGAINGSLWTIAVEFQFYVLTPLFFIYANKNKLIWAIALPIFIIFNTLNTFFNGSSTIIEKLIGVSFLPWFYMFLLGAYLSTNKKLQQKILSINASVYLFLYLISYYLSSILGTGTGNKINFISYIFLSLLIFKLAYTRPHLSTNLLSGNDISYGVYIYHMPIVNLFLYYGLYQTVMSFALSLLITFLMAIISWIVIEKPSLKLKKMTLRKYS